jgi:hypothetical protein
MPLIRDYVAEHERASDLCDHAIRAVFPASVVTMGGAEWDASVSAWSEAHSGEKMITD